MGMPVLFSSSMSACHSTRYAIAALQKSEWETEPERIPKSIYAWLNRHLTYCNVVQASICESLSFDDGQKLGSLHTAVCRRGALVLKSSLRRESFLAVMSMYRLPSSPAGKVFWKHHWWDYLLPNYDSEIQWKVRNSKADYLRFLLEVAAFLQFVFGALRRLSSKQQGSDTSSIAILIEIERNASAKALLPYVLTFLQRLQTANRLAKVYRVAFRLLHKKLSLTLYKACVQAITENGCKREEDTFLCSQSRVRVA